MNMVYIITYTNNAYVKANIELNVCHTKNKLDYNNEIKFAPGHIGYIYDN